MSWYQDTAASPARVSFVNADSLDGGGSTYNSATLVIPAGRTVRPIKTHAGGIAWYKHYLFVAETHVGVRVFDINYILGAKKLPPTRRPQRRRSCCRRSASTSRPRARG